MTKARLIKDFENGICAITWNSVYAEAKAVYFNGENGYRQETIRFDTYLSLDCIKYPTNRNYSHGADYLREWTFADDMTRDIFLERFTNVKKITWR